MLGILWQTEKLSRYTLDQRPLIFGSKIEKILKKGQNLELLSNLIAQ